jgi:hypothetical protein
MPLVVAPPPEPLVVLPLVVVDCPVVPCPLPVLPPVDAPPVPAGLPVVSLSDEQENESKSAPSINLRVMTMFPFLFSEVRANRSLLPRNEAKTALDVPYESGERTIHGEAIFLSVLGAGVVVGGLR